jgi:3-hydroxyisobutyrate dehydrogenase-like beta-hydroxyacid dehydrogenase
MLDALLLTAVVSPAQKGKFENVKRGVYPAAFALRMMSKDYSLILRLAESHSVAMPATAAAKQIDIIENARSGGREEDFSAVVRTVQDLSGFGE